jgi:hypothetical protein
MQTETTEDPSVPGGRFATPAAFAVWPGWQVLMQDAGVNGANVLRRAQLPGDLLARESARLTPGKRAGQLRFMRRFAPEKAFEKSFRKEMKLPAWR